MSENTGFYQLVEGIHQQVRAFVEKEFPGYKVAAIWMDAQARYHPPMSSIADDPDKLQWLLIDEHIRFQVEASAFSGVKGLACEVFVLDDGTLRLGDQRFIVPSGYVPTRRLQ